MAIKFSVVIPTRSRVTYLRSCIKSVLTAVANADCEVEVLISDNASNDNTGEVVDAFCHPALRYVRRPKRLSMRMNFEACLNEVTGTHVIFIGDDDAVLPHGLAILRQVIEQTGANIVNWTLPGYSWPEPEANSPGYLKVFPGKLSGQLRKVDAKAALERMYSGTFRSYHDGAVTYHGCISKEVVTQAREASEGTYFWCSSPDVFAAMHNLMIDDVNFWKLSLPITLGGASPRSNGRSGQRMSRQAKKSASEFDKFIAESMGDPFNGKLPSSCPSLSLITLDGLLLASRFQQRPERIDAESWALRVAREIAGMTDYHRNECARYAEELIGAPLPNVPKRLPAAIDSAPSPKKALKAWPARLTLVGGDGMEDVGSAAQALDRICAMGKRWKEPPLFAGRAARSLGIAWRGRQSVLASRQDLH